MEVAVQKKIKKIVMGFVNVEGEYLNAKENISYSKYPLSKDSGIKSIISTEVLFITLLPGNLIAFKFAAKNIRNIQRIMPNEKYFLWISAMIAPNNAATNTKVPSAVVR